MAETTRTRVAIIFGGVSSEHDVSCLTAGGVTRAIDTERFKHVALKMCVEAGVELFLHTWFADAIVEEGVLWGVIVENKSGRQVLRARTLRTWDQSTVIPRFGFADPDDYYVRASAAGRLNELRVPALLVNTEHDPMVPAATVTPNQPM